MSDETKEGIPGLSTLSARQQEEVIRRYFNIVDYLYDVATNNLFHFIENIPCDTAKQVLLTRPEEVALKTIEQALNILLHGSRLPEDTTH